MAVEDGTSLQPQRTKGPRPETSKNKTVQRGTSLPMSRKLAYSSGNASSQFLQFAFITYFSFYFSPTQGMGKVAILPVAVTTGIVFYSRFLDGFLEPIVGYWSDNCQSRWGRRIPFLMFGGLPMCLFFFLLWAPPFAAGSTPMIVWVAACQILFWFGITSVFCPYSALLPEIAESSDDRVKTTQLQQVFLLVATGFVFAMPLFLKIQYGNLGMPIIISLVGLVSIYMPVIFIKEKQHRPHPDEKKYGILEALWWTMSNRAFVIYLVSSLLLLLGFQTILNSMLYLITGLLHKTDKFLPVVFGVIFGSVLISFIVIIFLQKKFTKKFLYAASILMLAVTLPLVYFLGGQTILGLPVLPVAFVIFGLLGLPVAGMMSLQTPIIADIADNDELVNGYRREAMFFGAQGFLQKFAIAATSLIQGYLFSHYGYSVQNPMGIRLLGPVTGFFVFLGFIVVLWYSLDEKTKLIRGKQKTMALIYTISFFLPPFFGIPIGLKYQKIGNETEKKAAKNCFALGILGLVFYAALLIYKFS